MTIEMRKGQEMYMGATTDEIIALFKEKPYIELECWSWSTRWLKYDNIHHKIGITDNIIYDWYSINDFRKYYGSWYWNFFIM